MPKYKVKYTVNVNNISFDQTLKNNIIPSIENRKKVFYLKTDMQISSIKNLPNTDLSKELIDAISVEETLSEILDIKRINE